MTSCHGLTHLPTPGFGREAEAEGQLEAVAGAAVLVTLRVGGVDVGE